MPNEAIYLTTVGYGTGALLGRGIKRVAGVYWLEELGLAQAVWVLDVEKFGPFLVESDLAGNSLFERENAKIAPGLEKLYAGTRPATLRRYGETDDKTEEVIRTNSPLLEDLRPRIGNETVAVGHLHVGQRLRVENGRPCR